MSRHCLALPPLLFGTPASPHLSLLSSHQCHCHCHALPNLLSLSNLLSSSGTCRGWAVTPASPCLLPPIQRNHGQKHNNNHALETHTFLFSFPPSSPSLLLPSLFCMVFSQSNEAGPLPTLPHPTGWRERAGIPVVNWNCLCLACLGKLSWQHLL